MLDTRVPARMPTSWSDKRERQYEHVKDSAKDRGASTKRAKEIAARTVNKDRALSGETEQGPGGPTRDQLYNEAKKENIKGRSKMTKNQLAKALGR